MTKAARINFKLLLTPRFQGFVIITLFLMAFALRLLPGPRTIDDAFITFRYARNILAGNGFVYNPGEQVLGTTTPLYTILLTIISIALGGKDAPFPLIAMVVNALADGLACALLYQLGVRLKHPLAGMATAIVWAIAPFSVTFAIGGLETSVYVLLLVATVYTSLSNQNIPAAFLGALAFLTRPDALILLLPLMLARAWMVWKERQRSFICQEVSQSATGSRRQMLLWAELGAFFLPVFVWITFATLYFGNPLPHSITAKALAYRLPSNAALIRFLQHYATPFLEHLTLGIYWIGVGLIIHPFFSIAGGIQLLKISQRAWPLIAYPWLYFAAFTIANPLIFRWYLTPPLPFYFFLILVGAEDVLTKLLLALARLVKREQVAFASRVGPILAGALVLLLPVGFSLRGWTLKPDHGISRPAPEMAWYQLELLYRQAANEIGNEIAKEPSPPTLAAGDVGVLGFYTQARILDTVGLNSPQSIPYYPAEPSLHVINYAIPPALILDNQPDYLVILEVYGRNGLLKNAQFLAAYRLRSKIPTDIYGSDGMLIFERTKRQE